MDYYVVCTYILLRQNQVRGHRMITCSYVLTCSHADVAMTSSVAD